ncbi:THAP domain-containing protein 1-like [Watersipora subatra]|uniref:THAP domain-containing protein 1-like n=1 Tax=Watersipora subatra TaxID=2589382 RepID=UPI00355C3712
MSSEETTTPQAKKKSSRSWCCAYGCSSNLEKCPDLAFHRFPNKKSSETRNAWVKAVRRQDWTPTSSSVLCSGYFQKDCYKVPPAEEAESCGQAFGVEGIVDAIQAQFELSAQQAQAELSTLKKASQTSVQEHPMEIERLVSVTYPKLPEPFRRILAKEHFTKSLNKAAF